MNKLVSTVKQRRHCRDCIHWHTGGIKDDKHNNWCCKFGAPARTMFGHCKNVNGKEIQRD